MTIPGFRALKRTAVLGFFAVAAVITSFGQSTHLSIDELKQVHLPDVKIEKVTGVSPDTSKNRSAKAHVQVEGVIGGTIRFELLLPDEWNGRFAMGGGGGFVGTVQNMARDSVNRGYATVGTDTGHEYQPGYMAGWARDNMEARVNFGFLAVHRTAEVAKGLIREYYGKAPERSYFLGCSRGGGQAMMEAQRYPEDFDGIVAGAPAFDWTGIAAAMVQIARALYPDPNHLDSTVLDKKALESLAKSILEQCDSQDGLKDGVIQDPASAQFDLSKVPGLSDAQRVAVEAIFRGARDIQAAHYPGFAPVAECIPDQWIAWIVGPVPQMLAASQVPDLSFAFSTQIFKYLIFNDPDWDYSTYDFSRYPHDSRLAASYLNATDPDLKRFKQRQGKLILWHGWADPALPAQATIEYYRKALENDPALPEFCRLFLIPGCLHCGGGPGASEIDWLAVITDWVEHSKAPEKLIAAKHSGGQLAMTRPLYPYPQRAVYSGNGDPMSADSFTVAARSENGFKPLFPRDGIPEGWLVRDWSDVKKAPPAGAVWKVVDGVLHGSEPRGTWLVTEKLYDNFELKFDFKLGERGNSGCGLRFPDAGDPAFDGLELQMVDPRYYPPEMNVPPSELTGSLYRAIAPREQLFKPLEWNSYDVLCEGPRIRVKLNGSEILDVNIKEYQKPILRHDDTPAVPFPDRPLKGHIGFQELSRGGGHVEIRNAQIREL